MEQYEDTPGYRTSFHGSARTRPGSGYRRKKRAGKADLSALELRRLLQLGCCVLVFLLMLAGRTLLPEKTAALRETALQALEHDTDFKAAFASLGEAISAGEPIRDVLGQLYVSVFGGTGIRAETPEEEDAAVSDSAGSEAAGDAAVETENASAETEGGAAEVSVLEPTAFREERAFLSLAAGDTAAFLARRFPAAVLEDPPAAETAAETAAEAELDIAGEFAQAAIPTAAAAAPQNAQYAGLALPEGAKATYEPLGISYADPVSGEVSSGFGWRNHPTDGSLKFHNGIDIVAEKGTPIRAFSDGIVAYTGESTVYGRYLCITHENGCSTFYAHCNKVSVRKGQKVSMGDKVAEVGCTGNATGCHLHFEIKKDGVCLNPAYYYGVG